MVTNPGGQLIGLPEGDVDLDGATAQEQLRFGGEFRVNGAAADAIDDLVRQVEEWDTKFRAASTDVLYDVRIARTEHGNFSDLPLFFPRDTATMEPARAHAIITAYTLAFFDQHLRGVTSPLLDAPAAAYPEVTFVRRGATRATR